MPQKPVEKRIRDAGIWDLDALKLDENATDEWVSKQFTRISQELTAARLPAPLVETGG